MEITNYNLKSPYFGIKLNTASVLETTTLKIFKNDGIAGFKEVTQALSPNKIKAVGNRGYKYYAQLYGEKIITKYPEIAEATEQIKKIATENPHITKAELYLKIQPIINKLGDEIDITI